MFESLSEIVGEEFVSNRPEELYIYSRDLGTSEPHMPDYVVMPRTTEEVQAIVKLANQHRVPLVPLGGGLNLSGLTLALRGGIIVDMRRMDSILEVNEKSRYVLMEAGVSEGKLKSFLEENHPNLEHSMPEAPPGASVVANALLHGEGHLIGLHGLNSYMLNGLEVVLPTGEICRIGSCSLSPSWFSSGAPMPDLTGLFAGWLGTTGVVTKAAFKLYPKPKLRDAEMFMTENLDLVPDMVSKVIQTMAADDIIFGTKRMPADSQAAWIIGTQRLSQESTNSVNIAMWISGNSNAEIELKKRLLREALQEYEQNGEGEFTGITPDMKNELTELPTRSDTRSADILKGGGYEEADAFLPIDQFPQACRGMFEIADKYNLPFFSMMGRCAGAHSVKFYWSFRFNRGDLQSVEDTRQALHAATELGVRLGGLPSRPTVYGQRLALERMEPNTRNLMMRIKEFLDPNHIMNPGNWEIS